MPLFRPGTPFLKKLRDLFIGPMSTNPSDDTAGDFIARIRKAITSTITGAVAVPAAWITAKTGVEIPVEWYEPVVAAVVGGFLNWLATYFPWNRGPAT